MQAIWIYGPKPLILVPLAAEAKVEGGPLQLRKGRHALACSHSLSFARAVGREFLPPPSHSLSLCLSLSLFSSPGHWGRVKPPGLSGLTLFWGFREDVKSRQNIGGCHKMYDHDEKLPRCEPSVKSLGLSLSLSLSLPLPLLSLFLTLSLSLSLSVFVSNLALCSLSQAPRPKLRSPAAHCHGAGLGEYPEEASHSWPPGDEAMGLNII